MHEAFLSPDKARLIKKGTPQWALASMALRALWHAIFDLAPKTLTLAPPDGKELMEGFLRWGEARSLSMNWAMHAHLLQWLANESDWSCGLDGTHVKELLAASSSRWTRESFDFLDERGILLYSPLMPGYAVASWRKRRPDERARTSLVTVPTAPSIHSCSYALSCRDRIWRDLKWQSLPM